MKKKLFILMSFVIFFSINNMENKKDAAKRKEREALEEKKLSESVKLLEKTPNVPSKFGVQFGRDSSGEALSEKIFNKINFEDFKENKVTVFLLGSGVASNPCDKNIINEISEKLKEKVSFVYIDQNKDLIEGFKENIKLKELPSKFNFQTSDLLDLKRVSVILKLYKSEKNIILANNIFHMFYSSREGMDLVEKKVDPIDYVLNFYQEILGDPLIIFTARNVRTESFLKDIENSLANDKKAENTKSVLLANLKSFEFRETIHENKKEEFFLYSGIRKELSPLVREVFNKLIENKDFLDEGNSKEIVNSIFKAHKKDIENNYIAGFISEESLSNFYNKLEEKNRDIFFVNRIAEVLPLNNLKELSTISNFHTLAIMGTLIKK